MTEDLLLRARDITRRVPDGDGSVLILDRVNVEIHASERVALVGPSGSGKSTLLQILGALEEEYEGHVEIAGQSLSGRTDRELAAMRNQFFGFVFQSYNLLGHLSALDNVLLPARFSGAAVEVKRGRTILEQLGLGDKSNRFPLTLSGGERQRVAIARALYHRPPLVLCDEPTGNLDHQTGAEILALFEQLSGDGVALLIATHDQAIAASADRQLNLQGGRLQ